MAPAAERLLDDVVIAEMGGRLSTAYGGRLLSDLGATVCRVDTGESDPLQREDPAYYAYLHAGKTEVSALSQVVDCDVVVCDSPQVSAQVRSDRGEESELVVVTVSDYGLTGPWAGCAAAEITLQAEAGMVALHRVGDQPPVMAGVDLGELLGGVNAAIGAVQALLSREAGAGAVDVDVSRFESLVSVQQYPWLFRQIDGHTPYALPADSTPGIEAAADGDVCIVAITPDQWVALKKIVGVPALDDPRFDDAYIRGQHHEEVSRIIRSFTGRHTVAELVELGAQHRVPITPVATARNAATLPPFAARHTYLADGLGGCLRPRPPYRIALDEGTSPTEPTTPGSRRVHRPPLSIRSTPQLPLRGVRVVEFGLFQAGPLVTAYLATLGADVVKVEAIKRPDLIRFSGGFTGTSQPWERSAGFIGPNLGKRAITADLSDPRGLEIASKLIQTSDMVLDNYAPRTLNGRGLDFTGLRQLRSDAVILRMPAWGLQGPWADRPGFTYTANAMSGMADVTGYADGDPLLSGTIIDPIAAQFGTLVSLAALRRRAHTGLGADVEMALCDVAAQLTAQMVIRQSSGAPPLVRSGNRRRHVLYQDTVKCDDGQWVAVAVRNERDLSALSAGFPDEDEENLTSDDDSIRRMLSVAARTTSADCLVARLRELGVPAARMASGCELVDHPQLNARGRVLVVEHPVVGAVRCVGAPARFSHDPQAHAMSHSPLFGEHNAAVLAELGYTPAERSQLMAEKVIGDSPFGLPLP